MQTIKAERLRQGVKGKQLAERMQVSPARVSVLERDEDRGALTLAMLQRAAEALGCRLEYRLVPAAATADKPRLKLVSDDSDAGYSVSAE